MEILSLDQLVAAAKTAFQAGDYVRAAGDFSQAALAYARQGNTLMEAEMKNNQSVCLLQAEQPQAALDLVLGTDKVFAQAGDVRRQGLAVGNQAAALEALGSLDEAAQAYNRSADLLGQAGESDLSATVLKSRAALDLKRGKISDSALNMMGHLSAVKKPTLFQRILKFILRFRP